MFDTFSDWLTITHHRRQTGDQEFSITLNGDLLALNGEILTYGA